MKEYLWKDKFQVFLSIIILLVLWEVIALSINNNIYLPTLGEVGKSIKYTITDEKFIFHIYSSMSRAVLSFIVALIMAILLGVLASFSNFFRNFLKPINSLVMSIPTMILVVLAIIWFNKNDTPFIVGFAIVFPIFYDAVVSAILNLDKKLLQMTQIYNFNIKDKILKVYFPAIKFQIVGIMLSTFSLALKVVVAGEVYGQPTYGMGTVIQLEKINFNTSGIFAWIIIIAFISFLLDKLQKIIEKRAFRWKN
ncbi:NitT/TauT family transport system permease protein [Clostridium collagenovorans DSM 3089]|uniref:NitT/TauT family transport system permease protein n=1 Tax=Clostridium collagenovorans DSM 3089 TaxID=1121306 RepID=A0A1M5U4R3_9CLOT|nr:ABC transporter permease subunit [Clostridium collagenovorans]SHH57928.1 NitT/TauT family transport system permease protein [Clostridium collagenovorans DSM 3089]